MVFRKTLSLSLLALIMTGQGFRPLVAEAEQKYASAPRTAAAMGHYARARTMLVQALAEFEEGRKYARPDMLLDSEEWRLSVISRTEELNRLLDPRPRVTRDGVRFQANKLLIRRERDRLPAVADGAQDNSSYGEKQRKKELRAARAKASEKNEVLNGKSKDEASSTRKGAEELLFKEADESTSDAKQKLSKEDEKQGVEEADAAATKAINRLGDVKAAIAATANSGEPIIEGEEEEVDTRAPILDDSENKKAKSDLFSDEVAKKPLADAAESENDEAVDEVSKAIEKAVQDRLHEEPPVSEAAEEEVLEQEIVRQ